MITYHIDWTSGISHFNCVSSNINSHMISSEYKKSTYKNNACIPNRSKFGEIFMQLLCKTIQSSLQQTYIQNRNKNYLLLLQLLNKVCV
jgi:hypothetical protein